MAKEFKDKSATHVRVIKNGIEGWIIKEVWRQMNERGKLEGFSEVASTPPEVEELKRKTEVSKVEEPIIEEELTASVEVKAKAKKK